MFLRLPGSPWNPAQQPGLGICLRFTVSNGVSGATAPEAAAIAAVIGWPLRYRSGRGGGGVAASEAVSLSL